MARRWTEREDLFIIAYYDAIGPYIGPHDLGRSEKATTDRAKFLKRSGAWDVYVEAQNVLNMARKLARHE